MKTFSNLYIVLRQTKDKYDGHYTDPIVMGVFKHHDSAFSFHGAEEQRMIDKGYSKDKYKFTVELGTYYDD